MWLLLHQELLFPYRVLVVMHPYLENFPANSNLITELIDGIFVLLLQPPTNSLRKAEHLFFLLHRKGRPKTLS
ncbi:hypothetical protein IEQ34_003152 [Dendrobium chrysotoxum]|uniref:Uncharacterized protein n=1 Tax=Dendrobium chrysotoxum TaxID=161865 RepID=A0AAV7H2V2_DENCH|nr:hypothetical protein IEQ34_003152 [Dendrobium chrysotoxum]